MTERLHQVMPSAQRPYTALNLASEVLRPNSGEPNPCSSTRSMKASATCTMAIMETQRQRQHPQS